MKVRAICALLLLMTIPTAARDRERLSMQVSPSVAIEPADVTIRTLIDSNTANRTIEIVAESAEFFRSSQTPLDGDRAPRSSQVQFHGLPGGIYTVIAVLRGVNDEVLSRTQQEVKVVGKF